MDLNQALNLNSTQLLGTNQKNYFDKQRTDQMQRNNEFLTAIGSSQHRQSSMSSTGGLQQTDNSSTLTVFPNDSHNRHFNNRTFAINPNLYQQQQQKIIGPQTEMTRDNIHKNPSYLEMSPSFLKMKQSSDLQNYVSNPSFQMSGLDRLKKEHALELQKNLSNQTQNMGMEINAGNFANNAYYANTIRPSALGSKKTCAYNAQGVEVSDNSSLYQSQENKYLILKKMSPEDMNKLYGRQSDESILPMNNNDEILGDIYEQTSCNKIGQYNPKKTHELQVLLENRQKEIMGQKPKKGIQCLYGSENGTHLTEAFTLNQ